MRTDQCYKVHYRRSQARFPLAPTVMVVGLFFDPSPNATATKLATSWALSIYDRAYPGKAATVNMPPYYLYNLPRSREFSTRAIQLIDDAFEKGKYLPGVKIFNDGVEATLRILAVDNLVGRRPQAPF